MYFSGNYSAMSRMLGITDSGLGSYIRGKKLKDGGIKYSTPSVDIIASIIEKLEINPEWLITGKGEMKKSSGDDSGGNVMDKTKTNATMEDRLLSIIESQQRTIELLSKKGGWFCGGCPNCGCKKDKLVPLFPNNHEKEIIATYRLQQK